jgi:hypothetical protein
VLDQNPLEDFKLLYGTGALRLNDHSGKAEWQRALRWTIKSGLVFDVDELLADVRSMVAGSWEGDPERPPRAG